MSEEIMAKWNTDMISDPRAVKDISDRRIATVKSHMRRYINEEHDIKCAGDMKAAIDSTSAN